MGKTCQMRSYHFFLALQHSQFTNVPEQRFRHRQVVEGREEELGHDDDIQSLEVEEEIWYITNKLHCIFQIFIIVSSKGEKTL